MVEEIHKNDIGTKFLVTIKDSTIGAVDVSTATVRQIIFKKEDGTIMTKTAIFDGDGTDGKIFYASVSGDLEPIGNWQMQGFVKLATWEGHSNVEYFEVHKNLKR